MPSISSYAIDSATAEQFRRLSGGKVRTVAGTTDTLVASDNGCFVEYTSASPVVVTVPSGLGARFGCTLVQMGGGQVTVNPGSGVTRNGTSAQYKTVSQYAVIGLIALAADTFVIFGDRTA